jgi:uncharacterized protein (UPF0332 family)
MATYQTVTPQDRIEVMPHLARAHESLRAAEVLRDAGLGGDCASRAHQACVHAERALLATEKRSPSDARSVHRMCTLHFLQNGQVPVAHLAAVERLAELRARADDHAVREPTREEAADAVAAAAGFVRDVAAWLERNGYRK